MIELAASLALACSPLTREDGRGLVLLAPSALAASAAGQAPAAQFKRLEAGEFIYRLSAADGHLIGWYAVNPLTGSVRNWIADGLPIVTSPQMEDRRRQVRDRHCS